MLIAVSGAQSVGKSTLVADLAAAFLARQDEQNYTGACRVEGEPFRALKDSLGLVSGAQLMSPEDELALIEYHSQRLTACCESSTREAVVVFDRCGVDALAHSIVAQAAGNAAFTSAWVARIEAACLDALTRIDLLVVVPVEDRVPLVSDGVRSTDRPYQLAVDAAIGEWSSSHCTAAGVELMRCTGARDERVAQVMNAIDQD